MCGYTIMCLTAGDGVGPDYPAVEIGEWATSPEWRPSGAPERFSWLGNPGASAQWHLFYGFHLNEGLLE
jgi:hypothetical protein